MCLGICGYLGLGLKLNVFKCREKKHSLLTHFRLVAERTSSFHLDKPAAEVVDGVQKLEVGSLEGSC